MAAVTTEPVDRMEERLRFREWRNLTDPQWAAIQAMALHPYAQVLMGGSGFGGKSYNERAAAVYWALRLVKEGWSTASSRRKILFAGGDYPGLKDRHFSWMIEEYGEMGAIRTHDKEYGCCFRFDAPEMPVICFRNLDEQRNRRGSEFCIGIKEEETELTAEQDAAFMYMVRDPKVPYNPTIGGTNPDGIGHFRIKAKFRPLEAMAVTPILYRESDPTRGAVFQAVGPLSEQADPTGRIKPETLFYVPFLPEDNPEFDEELFNRNIAGLPPHVQRARRYGTWDSPEGARWPLATTEAVGFDPETLWHSGVPESYQKMIWVDYGTRNPYCAIWAAVDYDGNVYLWQEDYKRGKTAWAQIERIKELTPQAMVISQFDGDPAMWIKVPNHTGDPEQDLVVAQVYNDGIAGDERFQCGFNKGSSAPRVHKWNLFDRYLERGNGYPDLYIAYGLKNVWMELQNAVYPKGTVAKDKSEDIDESCPDHALTAIAFGLHKHFGHAKRVEREKDPHEVAKEKAEKELERARRKRMRAERKRR